MFCVSLAQLDILYRNPEGNRKKIEKTVRELCQKKGGVEKPDLILFPETCTSGYSEEVFRDIERFAEENGGESLTLFQRLAKEYQVCICTGSIPEKNKGKIFNTVYFIDRYGTEMARYRKMHLYSAMGEEKAFSHGNEMPVFETEFGPMAMMTCYDIRFPELSRTYALRGAKAILTVSNFPNPKVNHWRTLLTARAIENQIYVIACNRVGKAGSASYFGHSMIINPWGEVVAEGREEESVVSGIADFECVSRVRIEIPMYRDRHPEDYPDDWRRQEGLWKN